MKKKKEIPKKELNAVKLLNLMSNLRAERVSLPYDMMLDILFFCKDGKLPPVFRYAKKSGISYPTARKRFYILMDIGIVKKEGKYFCVHKDYMKLIEKRKIIIKRIPECFDNKIFITSKLIIKRNRDEGE